MVNGTSVEAALRPPRGITRTIGEFETKDIGGVTLAVTDIVGSDRDSVKGYVEVIVGGVEVKLGTNNAEVEINDEKISDMNEDYLVTSNLGTGGFGVIKIGYAVDDDIVLEAGESLMDPLFGAFELTFNGINDVEWSSIELDGGSNDDELTVSGDMANGDSLDWFTLRYTTKGANGGDVYLKGDADDERFYFANSVQGISVDPLNLNASGNIFINASDNTGEGSGFFVFESEDEQYLYEVDSFDDSEGEADFTDLIEGTEDSEVSLNVSAATNSINTALEVKNLATQGGDGNTAVLDLSDGNYLAHLEMQNNAVINFSGVEAQAAESGYFVFELDSDVDGDQDADETQAINISFDMAADTDNEDVEITVETAGSGFVNLNPSDLRDASADSDGDDTQYFVTVYGTKVEWDNEDKYSAKVWTPDEQVRADVSLVFGEAGSVLDVIVSADEADAKIEELEADGATIIGTKDMSNDVEVDVDAPMMDSEVSDMSDLIVVGGPAVNSVARDLLGIDTYTIDQAGVSEGQYVHRYFEDKNVVLVYGYSAADTTAGVNALNSGNTDFE